MSRIKEKKVYFSLAEEVADAIERTGWVAHNKLEDFLKPFAITTQQLNVLSILRTAKGSLPTLDIGKRMFQKLPDVSRLIDRLEKLGFVTREKSNEDRRVVFVNLTPEGLKKVNDILKPMSDACTNYFSHMTEEEQHLLISLLEKARRDEG